MGDARIPLFANHWYGLNKAEYGHTPFWTKKEPKLVKTILQQMDSKQLDHKLTFEAATFYFKQKGFEKTAKAHDFGFFFINYQKYLQAVLPTNTKVHSPPIQKTEEKIDPEAMRKSIAKEGEKFIPKLLKSKKWMPKNLYQKSVTICIELFGQRKCAVLTATPSKKPEIDRKQQLLDQVKIIKENV